MISTLQLFDTKSLNQMKTYKTERNVNSAALSPNMEHVSPNYAYIFCDIFLNPNFPTDSYVVTIHLNTVKSWYLEVDGTIFYKFKLPEVQINLHFG